MGSQSDEVDPLTAECRRSAEWLHNRLDGRFHIVIRSPFVLAGDLMAEQLNRYYDETIVPTQRALSAQFFDTPPAHPIVVLLLRNDDSYRDVSISFDGLNRDCYAGYYIRDERRIVVNVSTGNGTLAHELAHALAHADCESLPEWFDEGFASLFEESEFSHDGFQLIGLPNWRIHYLGPALKTKRLPSIESMITRGEIRSGNQGLDYALARYLCLYLQDRRLLGPYYRKLRHALTRDPTGRTTLLQLLQEDDIEAIDTDFDTWLRSTYRSYVNDR